MPKIADLVVPEAGRISDVLPRVRSLCRDVEETTSVCEHLHRRLVEICDEPLKREKNGDFHHRTLWTSIVYRVVEYWTIVNDLLQINQDVTKVFELCGISSKSSWRDEWDDDVSSMKEVIAATARDNAAVLRDMQDPRVQREALLTPKFEMEQRAARHDERIILLMKSIQATIALASKTPEAPLPPCPVKWRLNPSHSPADPMDLYWGPGTKVVVKRFLVKDQAIDQRAQLKIEKEMNIWYQLNLLNVIKMFGASHVSSPPFIAYEDAVNGDLGVFLIRLTPWFPTS
ncbi:hypothetical protein PHYSODRAFT_246310 [Phytophthora sojae]|uniref:Protein kinase domain-containing protein n=1 Tax=Phytophthora sojae (strain P6497) TaxID=1094619 RepID=G4YGH4_PHYSP|nr:hypothetical protein PHYSODRAFT_246310 [Phytophthora sojae]EGZ29087.1 hypothetical protein PHYSODRAFT_246310 [Phytophthora sojae]|eukprot:XP_009516362.1 hypothetical protein PHYSODRAFT_246310 [Phytophthora sojae]